MNNSKRKLANSTAKACPHRTFALIFVALVTLIAALGPRCFAQTPAHRVGAPEQLANANQAAQPESSAAAPETGISQSKASQPANLAEPAMPAEVIKELERMRARIDQLEKELKARTSEPAVAAAQPVPAVSDAAGPQEPPAASKGAQAQAEAQAPAAPF